MDATRSRRTRDCVRQRWYAAWRCQRFARHLGFTSVADALPDSLESETYSSTHHLAQASVDQEVNGPWELLLCSY